MQRKIAIVTGEENLKKAFEDLFHVLVNLRFWTKDFEEKYGVSAKKLKKDWEARADKLIDDLEKGEYTPMVTSKRRSEQYPETKRSNH